MRLEDGRESGNVEDRRGSRRGGLAIGGGIGSVVLVVIALLLGVDPAVMLDQAGMTQGGAPAATERTERAAPPANDEGARFVRRVLAETEDVWNPIFAARGQRYVEPRLVLFTGAVDSACGMAQAAVGPFYCPGDSRVYIDLDFLAELQRRLGAPGDFAAAYVIAHEVGHHVQNQLGLLARAEGGREGANARQVRIELQADCLAGLWARRAQDARGILEPGDIEEGLNAAAAVGDDRMQQSAGRRVTPDSFTHGSAAQRMRWFKTGLDTGRLEACDTFATNAR